MDHGHPGNFLLYGTILINLVSELRPLSGMVHSFCDHCPHCARQSSTHAKPSIVQDLHGHLETVAFSSEHVLHGDGDVFEVDLGRVGALDSHLLLGRSVCDAAEFALDNKGGDLVSLRAGGGILYGGLGEHGEDLGDSSVGDPDLGAVHDVVLSVRGKFGPGLDGSSIGARSGLRESESGKLLTGSQLGKVLLFLGISTWRDKGQ